MHDLRATLVAVDQVLAECDASRLPLLGYACLRVGCLNGVLTWLNPFYCSEKCRADANDDDRSPSGSEDAYRSPQNMAWIDEIHVWNQATEPAAPDPRGPVSLGWDPAGGGLVAVRSTRRQIVVEYVVDMTPVREAIARMTEVARRAGMALTAWQEQTLLALDQVRAGRAWLNRKTGARPARPPEYARQPDPLGHLPEPMRHALELRRNRNTGPAPRRRPPRRIDPPGGFW